MKNVILKEQEKSFIHCIYLHHLQKVCGGKKKTTSEKHLVTKQMFYFESQTLRFINEDYY